jgi:hypothetical protein
VTPAFATPRSLADDGVRAEAMVEARRQAEMQQAELAKEASAQQDGSVEPGTPAPRSATDGTPVLNISFPGGSVAQFVDLLRKGAVDAGKQANVLLKEGAGQVVLPPMNLSSVALSDALRVLHQYEYTDSSGPSRLELDSTRSGGGAPIFVLSTQSLVKGTTREFMVHVWNVSNLLKSEIKAEDILTAVEAALELAAEDGKQASIKFHEATGLIMARGDGGQISTIEQVVSELGQTAMQHEQDLAMRRELERAAQAKTQATMLEKEVRDAHAVAAALDNERSMMARELEVVRHRNEDMLQQQQQRIFELEQVLARRDAELQELRRTIEQGKKE